MLFETSDVIVQILILLLVLLSQALSSFVVSSFAPHFFNLLSLLMQEIPPIEDVSQLLQTECMHQLFLAYKIGEIDCEYQLHPVVLQYRRY